MRILLSFCLALVLMIELALPSQVYSISIRKEEDMGREFVKAITKQRAFIQDEVVVKYINQVGQRILKAIPVQPLIYKFYMIKDDTYNAFAVPGGHVFINSGLFNAMENEEELAGIIAHEIAHVMCRHISKRIESSSKIGLLTLAGLAAGILLGSSGDGNAAGALTIGAMAAGQSLTLSYSRADERQADQIGMKSLAEAGYNGTGMLSMLKKIRNKQWYNSKDISPYLMTHPAVEERIAYIDSWLQSRDSLKTLNPKKTALDFERIHTRFLILYGEKDEALKIFKAEAVKKDADASSYYRYGLILSRTGNKKEATRQLKAALAERVFDLNILRALGINYYYSGQYSEALNTLKSAISIDCNDWESLLYLGRTQIALEKPESAISIFERIAVKYPDKYGVYYYMGKAYGKQKKSGKAYYYLGIYYYKKGKIKNAVFHLKTAKKYLKDKEKIDEINEILKRVKTKKLYGN